MPEVTITIGDRDFQVACQAGEEHFLTSAAGLLGAEAKTLVDQIGRLPEARMLLMSGLMLADKTAGLDERLKTAEKKIAQQEATISELESRPAETTSVEVAVIPPSVTESLANIALRAEALAQAVDDAS
ncbi:MAG: cell division protein ZapA [Pseudoruegeria sp.]